MPNVNSTQPELFLSDEVQSLLDDFAALFDIRVTLFAADGIRRLRRGQEMRNCEFCRIVQESLGGPERCQMTDVDRQAESAKTNAVLSYRCHAGLYESIAPVMVRGKLAGFLMIGQYRIEGAPEPECLHGGDNAASAELRRAYEELPSFSQEKLRHILGLFKTLIDYIAVRELAVIQDDELRREIDRYIEKHSCEAIRLPEMARKLGRSVSTISQFLRRNYHTSFKELVIEYRLRSAEHFWQAHPEATVAEAAFCAGFSDQFYFSRVFRRRRGITPGAYREQLRQRRA